MRRLAIGLGMLALSGCAMQQPDRVYPVFFNDFSANLDPAGMTVVDNAAAVAKQYPRIPVRVTGYSDRAGSPEADISLSRARADAVTGLLVKDGVDASRITPGAIGTPPNSQPGVERRRVTIVIDFP